MIDKLKDLFKTQCTGWDDRATKDFFMSFFNLKDDRPIRNTIAELRKENMLIISNTTFKGYFLTTEKRLREYPIELKHATIMRGENRNRVKMINEMIYPTDQAIERVEKFLEKNQLTLKDEKGKGLTY